MGFGCTRNGPMNNSVVKKPFGRKKGAGGFLYLLHQAEISG